jgi:hypothetical protein
MFRVSSWIVCFSQKDLLKKSRNCRFVSQNFHWDTIRAQSNFDEDLSTIENPHQPQPHQHERDGKGE